MTCILKYSGVIWLVSATAFERHPEKSNGLLGEKRDRWKHGQVCEEANRAQGMVEPSSGYVGVHHKLFFLLGQSPDSCPQAHRPCLTFPAQCSSCSCLPILSFTHSVPTTQASLLILQHSELSPASGPLHMLLLSLESPSVPPLPSFT